MNRTVGVLVVAGLFSAPGAAQVPQLVRGPYLQSQTATSIVVRWRTDVPAASAVRYGLTALDEEVQSPDLVTEHALRIEGLSPGTAYRYEVGTPTETLYNEPTSRLRTAPAPGVPAPFQVWVLGDSGTADLRIQGTRDAYLGYVAGVLPAVWLMLGDNAYNNGTDDEYQAAVFDTFPTVLPSVPLWPTLGNHDGASASSAAQSGVYYDIFTLPAGGEAGGVPSGTEAYYSFDYAHVHFVCLDSHDTDRDPLGPMATWLALDLASTTQPFIVAFWHHPPYSKGSHNSDNIGSREQDMREAFVPILEAHGVDLVLAGHSHNYERSHPTAGHYGRSDTFESSHRLDARSGDPADGGAYTKSLHGDRTLDGAVYTVAGASAKTGGGSLNHPIMRLSVSTRGSLILDVEPAALTATYLTDTGEALDTFRIEKNLPDLDIVGGPRRVYEGEPLTLRAVGPAVDAAAPTWTFGDGGVPQTAAQVVHSWRDDGLAVVTAAAGDASDTITVDVQNLPPIVTGTLSGDLFEGEPITVAVTATDPGPEDTLVLGVITPGGEEVVGESWTHVFDDNGTYLVTATAVDDDGGRGTAEVVIDVQNRPPQLSVQAPLTTVEAGTFFSLLIDAQDAGAADTITLSTDLGDGTTSSLAAVQHAYALPGTYPVVVTATDDDGGAATVALTVEVVPSVPGLLLAVPERGAEGSPLTFAAGSTVPVTVQWDFGDGSPAGQGTTASHAYEDDGIYVLTATLTAAGEEPAVRQRTVVVDNIAPTLHTRPPLPPADEDLVYLPVATDPGPRDVLQYHFEAVPPTTLATTPTPPRLVVRAADRLPGTIVTLTVRDGDGGEITQRFGIAATNFTEPEPAAPDEPEPDPVDPFALRCAHHHTGRGLPGTFVVAAGLVLLMSRRRASTPRRRRR